MARQHQQQLATRAVHAGTAATAGDFTPTAPPIHHSSTFRYETMEELDAVFGGTRSGYVYSRFGNPTTAAFEEAVTSLESADCALAFASGMAALHAALLASGARSGATVVAARDIYGATQSLLSRIFGSQGVTTRFVDTGNLDEVRTACAELGPIAIVVETISNPLLRVADLPSLAEIAHNTGATLLVDNTFASPYLVQPFKLGADMVIHSATKYLGGHGDVLGGVVASSTHWHNELLSVRKLTGANLGPQEAWLALRGIRTLAVRMRQHCENALTLAHWLSEQPEVSRVIYPGLPDHPQHTLSGQLFEGRGYGGMISFELGDAGQTEVFRFLNALQLCLPATSLGDVETLLLYPAHSSHRSLSPEERARLGISDGLVRMSVGIEAVEDLKEDLQQALKTVKA